jgi:hypothetical protein
MSAGRPWADADSWVSRWVHPLRGMAGPLSPWAREHRLSRLLAHVPKCEIDAAFDRRRSFWHLVNPEALSLASHDQPKSLTKFKRDCLLRSSVSKLKAARRTKGQAGDGRTIPETRLMIAMPADTVAAISIEIEKDRVVRCARNCFGSFAQALNNCRKRRGSVADTAVRVISIAEPGRHPRNRQIPAEQACGFDPPRDDFGKTRCDSWPFELAICVVD